VGETCARSTLKWGEVAPNFDSRFGGIEATSCGFIVHVQRFWRYINWYLLTYLRVLRQIVLESNGVVGRGGAREQLIVPHTS